MTRRRGLLLLALLVAGCAVHPLGDDWEQLDDAARDARAIEVLRGLVEGGTDGAGSTFRDREVLEVDAQLVRYHPLDEPEQQPSTLRWRDVEAVEGQPLTTLPSRPETLFLYLRPGSERGVKDRVTPVLASAGLARPYLLLRSRPRWARSRMVLALDHLRARRNAVAPVGSASPAPVPSGAAPAPAAAPTGPGFERGPRGPAEGADEIEAKLRRLREWRDQGLIGEEEYQAKKQELLRRL
ncbi:MAG: SHOCT domain-containing protein [Planctomycetota bacterium]